MRRRVGIISAVIVLQLCTYVRLLAATLPLIQSADQRALNSTHAKTQKNHRPAARTYKPVTATATVGGKLATPGRARPPTSLRIRRDGSRPTSQLIRCQLSSRAYDQLASSTFLSRTYVSSLEFGIGTPRLVRRSGANALVRTGVSNLVAWAEGRAGAQRATVALRVAPGWVGWSVPPFVRYAGCCGLYVQVGRVGRRARRRRRRRRSRLVVLP